MKKTLSSFILISIISIFTALILVPVSAQAADNEYRMRHGEQDALIIGEIEEAQDGKCLIRTIHVISCKEDNTLNRQLPAEEIPELLTVSKVSYQESYHARRTPLAGDILCISLDRDQDIWKQNYLALELSSSDFSTLETAAPENMDASAYAWQLFLRSQGQITEFTFDSMDLYADGELVFSWAEHQAALRISSQTAFNASSQADSATAPEASASPDSSSGNPPAAISVIGGADGPTSIFLAGKIGNAGHFFLPGILLIACTFFLIRKKAQRQSADI